MGLSWNVGGVSGVWATTALLLGEFGLHHNSREKIVRMLESIRKRRGTRISKKILYWIRFGGVVTEIVWVFLELGVFLGFGWQQHYYCELSATTTTIERKSFICRRASEKEGERVYPKILFIG